MTDIVVRLRDESIRQQLGGHSGAFYDEAADRIEGLEEASVVDFKERDRYLKENERLREVLGELIEVAALRGDTDLPHPEDDPLLWNVRMQEAWDDAERVIRGEDE